MSTSISQGVAPGYRQQNVKIVHLLIYSTNSTSIILFIVEEISAPGICVAHPDIFPVDELEAEELEGIEVFLYRMLHHAPSEDSFLGTNIDVTEDKPSKDQNSVGIQTVEINSDTPPSELAKKHLTQKSLTKQLNQVLKSPKIDSKHLKNWLSDLSGPRKTNPYSKKYLIVEKSDHSRRLSEVITLLNEDDSQYRSKAKSFASFSSKKRIISLLANILTPDESDSNDSILILSKNEPTKLLTLKPRIEHHVFQSSDCYSSSSSEDSEVKVTYTSVSSSPIDTSDIQLNVSDTSESRNLVDIVRNGSQTFNWKSYSSSNWTPEMIEFYNQGGDGVDLDAVYQSLSRNFKWTVHAENLDGGLENLRYFESKRLTIKCANCNICGLSGHISFGCPPKCFPGCSRLSKILIECFPECRRERNAVYIVCRFNYYSKICPDLWRMCYSITTQQDEPIAQTDHPSRSRGPLYDSNCTKRGHLAVDCHREYRWSIHALSLARMAYCARSPNKGAPKTNHLHQ